MIDTDSRYRFERHVDKEFTLKASNYTAHLILAICRGEIFALKMAGSDKVPVRTIDFPNDFFVSRTGFHLSREEIISILEKLGFNCKNEEETIQITIPSWRYDFSIKEDIVEEIARIYGYDKIPVTPPSR